MALGALAVDLVEMATWHPRSYPSRRLQLGLTPGSASELEADRLILAAARKYRAWLVKQDASEPGPFGMNAVIQLLARRNTMGA